MKILSNMTTVELSDPTTEIEFLNKYRYFHVQNLGDAEIKMSLLKDADTDGSISCLAGNAVSIPCESRNDKFYISGAGKINVIASDSATNPYRVAGKDGGISPDPSPEPVEPTYINIDALYDVTSIDIPNNTWHNVLAPDDKSYDFVLSGNIKVSGDEIIFEDDTAVGVRKHQTKTAPPTFYVVAYTDTDYFTENNPYENVAIISDNSSTVVFPECTFAYGISCIAANSTSVYKNTIPTIFGDRPDYYDIGVVWNKHFNVISTASSFKNDNLYCYFRGWLNGTPCGLADPTLLWGGDISSLYNYNDTYMIHGYHNNSSGSTISTVPVHIKAIALSNLYNLNDVHKNSLIMLDKYVISKEVTQNDKC